MITMTHPIQSAVTRDQAIVRAVNSINLEQAGIIAGIAQTSGQDWDLQVVDDYDGYRAILIETTVYGDEQKGFYIAGTAQRLELFETHDDCVALVGTFTDIEALSARLTGLVGPQ